MIFQVSHRTTYRYRGGATLCHNEARLLLRKAIRHEAWHQGQIAALLRDAFEPDELWKLG